MTDRNSPKKIPAVCTACLFGIYGFCAGAAIGFGVEMDNISALAVLRSSVVLFIFPTFCGLLICRRFWASLDVVWLACLALPPLTGFMAIVKPTAPMGSQLIGMALPIFTTGLLSIVFLRWRDKKSKRNESSA